MNIFQEGRMLAERGHAKSHFKTLNKDILQETEI